MNEISTLIKKYISYLKVLNYSPITQKNYRSHLRKFTAFLRAGQITQTADITKETIREYQIYLYEEINHKGEQNSVGSQFNDFKVVKSLFRYFKENDFIMVNPAKDIPYPKLPEKLPRSILTNREMQRLLESIDTTNIVGYRDRTILEVMYTTGLRRRETRKIKIEDVDYESGYIRVKGKGNKDRVVPVGKIACRYLENYIKAIRPKLAGKETTRYLFLSIYGKSLSKNGIGERLAIYAAHAGIKKNVTPHTIRHTCATLMLKNKANIRHIQELLGHKSLNSTQIYTHLTITDLKEVHKRCHPRDQMNV